MSEDARPPPENAVSENAEFDTTDDKTVTEKASETVARAARGVGAAYDEARKPGMPLSILSNVVREAPLGSLLVAFLLGVALARRR